MKKLLLVLFIPLLTSCINHIEEISNIKKTFPHSIIYKLMDSNGSSYLVNDTIAKQIIEVYCTNMSNSNVSDIHLIFTYK